VKIVQNVDFAHGSAPMVAPGPVEVEMINTEGDRIDVTVESVIVGGVTVASTDWSVVEGVIKLDPGVTVKNGDTIEITFSEGGLIVDATEWKYGDILAIDRADPSVADRRYMYICDDVSEGLIRMLTLIGRKEGEIVQEYESEMRKVEA